MLRSSLCTIRRRGGRLAGNRTAAVHRNSADDAIRRHDAFGTILICESRAPSHRGDSRESYAILPVHEQLLILNYLVMCRKMLSIVFGFGGHNEKFYIRI